MTAPLEEPAAAPADTAYRWAVRALYLGLIAGNLFILWESYRDSPEYEVTAARIRRRLEALRNCEGCARRKAAIAAAANRLIFEAGEYLEAEAAAAGEEGAS